MAKHIINGENFNPLFYELERWVNNDSIRQIIIYGGTSAGKTYSICQSLLINGYNKKFSSIIFRKESTSIEGSVFNDFKTIKNQFSFTNKFNYFYRKIKYKENEIIFKGLDDPEKVKGLSAFKKIYANEISKFNKADYDELLDRMRGVAGQQLITDFNPISENHWVKKEVIDLEEWTEIDTLLVGINSFTKINKTKDIVLIRTTYLDNKWVIGPYFIDKHAINRFEYHKLHNLNRYRINALGEWGVDENVNQWLYEFDRKRHVVDNIAYMPDYPVYLSFDFNKDPLTCLAFQMSPSKGDAHSFIHIFKEYSGKLTIGDLCMKIKTDFPASILYVTGDRSGNEEGSIVANSLHESAYSLIQAHLGLNKSQMHLNSHNSSHESSRYMMNMMFKNYHNLRISLKGCPLYISDCELAKVDDKSSKPHQLYKDRDIYKMDLFDGGRYFFQQYFTTFAKSNYFKI